jgi:hypothetical protein
LRPLGNHGFLKTLSFCDFEIIFDIFSKYLKNGVYFHNILKSTPGAAFGGALRGLPRPEEGVFFQKRKN